MGVAASSPTSPESGADRTGRLIVLSGASGSGKSTLVARLLGRSAGGLAVSVSATTREPRPGETPGVSYHFVSRDEFEASLDRNEFLEWAFVHGHYYGTPLGPVVESLSRGICIILVIDVQGAFKVRSKQPDAVLIFVQAPSFPILEGRLRARGTDDEATIERRLINARREIAESDRYDHQIVNDDLDRATEELATLLAHYRCGG